MFFCDKENGFVKKIRVVKIFDHLISLLSLVSCRRVLLAFDGWALAAGNYKNRPLFTQWPNSEFMNLFWSEVTGSVI